jgi:hypothetical protein
MVWLLGKEVKARCKTLGRQTPGRKVEGMAWSNNNTSKIEVLW